MTQNLYHKQTQKTARVKAICT